MGHHKFYQGLQTLSQAGFNIVTVVDCAELSDELNQVLRAEKIFIENYRRLVLIGSGGKTLWKVLNDQGPLEKDAIQRHSEKKVGEFIDTVLGNSLVRFLFPASHPFPIQRLSRWAGVTYPSPLGMDIHPVYGIWSAYRAIFLTDLELPFVLPPTSESPCDACRAKPCVSACPVSAVREVHAFDMKACSDFRVRPDSICADQCLSRLACPVAPEHRYSPEQIHYHYAHALKSIRQYQSKTYSVPLKFVKNWAH